MDFIFNLNMQAMMIQPKPEPEIDNGPKKIRLNSKSYSSKIIIYLLKNGATTGSDLAHQLKLKHSAGAYIQPHLEAGRVICTRIHPQLALYSINPELSANDFIVY